MGSGEWPDQENLEGPFAIPLYEMTELEGWLAGRKTIYLDTCIWIDLVQNPSTEENRFLELARATLATGKAVFPVSFAGIMELIERGTPDQFPERARLMDELSHGIAIPNFPELLATDSESACPLLLDETPTKVTTGPAFIPAIGFLFRPYLYFTEGPVSEAKAHAALAHELLCNGGKGPVSLAVQSFLPAVDQAAVKAQDHAWVAERTDLYATYPVPHMGGKIDRSAMLEQARGSLLKNGLCDALCDAGFRSYGFVDFGVKMEKAVQEARLPILDLLFAAMPIADLYCRVLTERAAQANRRVQRQDCFDEIHMVQGLGCCDFFCTNERSMAALIRGGPTIPNQVKRRMIRGLPGINQILEDLLR